MSTPTISRLPSIPITADARADDIPGDLGPPGNPSAMWGLHLVDVNVAMGNLVAIVGRQVGRRYQRRRRPLAGGGASSEADRCLIVRTSRSG